MSRRPCKRVEMEEEEGTTTKAQSWNQMKELPNKGLL